ncbi:hypothetical protein AB0N31_07865 [Streptomyces sp. NPDC051051]|uniref:hypothetical protein n=1 Tax=Streptomyces sp. NPDC051051 TaxID=3155666 RepID=UPI00342BE563
MLDGEEHWNAVPAEILLSRKVGALHVKLVGDLISVTAQLDLAARSRRPGFALDGIVDYEEQVGPLEEAYRAAWQAVEAAPDRERRVPELDRLATALTAAVEGVAGFARQRGVEVRLYRFGDTER